MLGRLLVSRAGLRRVAWLPCLAVVLAAAACSNVSGDGEGGEGGSVAPTEGLRFEATETLELAPLETVGVEFVGPPGATVSLLLLGDAHDASLDAAAVALDAQGRGFVELRAPSEPSTFRLRAQLGAIWAERSVAVSAEGFAPVEVVPKYDGARDVVAWTASIRVGAACAEFLTSDGASPDGALVADAGPGDRPLIESVPLGPVLTVGLRAGKIALGCREVALPPGGDPTRVVEVEAIDRPMNLSGARLHVALEFQPDEAVYGPAIVAAGQRAIDNAFGLETPLSERLLAALAEVVPSDLHAAFEAHATASALADAVDAVVSGLDVSGLCAMAIDEGLDSALVALAAESTTLEGRLDGTDDLTRAAFALENVDGLAISEMGPPSTLAWTEETGDVLVVSGTIELPARALADGYARSGLGGASLPDALGDALACETSLGAAIGGFEGCDATCGRDLCRAALEHLWTSSLVASDDEPKLLVQVAASASAEVDAEVAPIALDGTWVGDLETGDQSGPLGGYVVASTPSDSP
jgi:hypothetical protein